MADLVYDRRIRGETALAFEYFKQYCFLGLSRSHQKLTEIEVGGKRRKRAQFGKWSVKYHWMERVRAYDAARSEQEFALMIAKVVENRALRLVSG
jgi:hypothetical protein